MAKRDNPRLRNENNKRSGKNTRAQKQQAAARKDAPKRERRPRPTEDRGYARGYEERGFDGRSFEERNSNIIIGRNPVMEALKSGREIDKILVSAGDGSIVKIVGMAKDKGLPIIKAEKTSLDRIAQGGAHQGIIAYASAYEYKEIDDILAKAEKQGEEPFVIILDNLEDPHNLGAIMRTAECAGAHGVIIPKRNACGLTETVAKTSAGAIEYMPCVRVTNIVTTIEELKEKGFWVAACDMGGQEYYRADLSGKLAVVIGSEGAGISRLVKENCDFTVSMPMVGKITSLNASNAAAVLMYEVRRQRDAKK